MSSSSVLDNVNSRPFEADIQKLLNLIIRSVYSNNDVFLRELISNSSDAIDKVRISKLSENESSAEDYKIKIQVLDDGKVLEILDNGIGMDEQDLVKNLSTIAHSGTSDFMQKMKETDDMSQLIGQFGVGFYSSFLIASSVEVLTKKWHSSDVWKWVSDGVSSYTIEKSDDVLDMEHGTRIRLCLKDAEDEKSNKSIYAEEAKLKQIIKQHSQFINYPIELWVEKEREEDVTEEEEEEGNDNKDVVVEENSEEEEKKEKEKKTKKVKYNEWEKVNGDKPIWYKDPSNVSEEEYVQLYKSLGGMNQYEDPSYWKHFKAEGRHEFQGIFYLAPRAPTFGQQNENGPRNIRLYVKKVLIMEHCGKELIPEWMGFVSGVVDASDIRLNVSREMLQNDEVVRTLKKYIQKQIVKMVSDFCDNEREKYLEYYKQNHKFLKWGITQGEPKFESNLLWQHSKKEDEWITFDEYIEKYVVEDQKQIFVLTGDNLAQMKNSIFLERFTEKDICVLYMNEAIDEFVLQNITKYKDYPLVNITKDFESNLFDIVSDEKSTELAEENKVEEENQKDFFNFLKECLTTKISEVKVSKRLKESPACISANRFGWSGNFEKVMKSQALQENNTMMFASLPKTLELNIEHDLVKKLREKYDSCVERDDLKKQIQLFYSVTLLQSGFSIDDTTTFCKDLYELMK